MSAEGRPARETRTLNSRKSREIKRELGARFVTDLAIALSSVIYKDKKLPSDTSCTSCAFISEALTKLAYDLNDLSEQEKQEIKTSPGAIQSWLEGRTNPTPEKFTAIRQLLIKIKAPEELIPKENLFQ